MRKLFFLLADFRPLQAPINNIQCRAFMVYSRGHVGNVVYPCAYDPGFNTWLGTRCRIPSSDRFVVDCVIGRRVVVCVCVC